MRRSNIVYAGLIAISMMGCKQVARSSDTRSYCEAEFRQNNSEPEWCSNGCQSDKYREYRKREKLGQRTAERRATEECTQGINQFLHDWFKQEGH